MIVGLRINTLPLSYLEPELAVTVAKGIRCAPDGRSGVKIDAAIRGAKSQLLKTALNWGNDEFFL